MCELVFAVMCSMYGLIAYVFRFTSAWIIVVFTVERYIGICRPLDQHVLAMGHCDIVSEEQEVFKRWKNYELTRKSSKMMETDRHTCEYNTHR